MSLVNSNRLDERRSKQKARGNRYRSTTPRSIPMLPQLHDNNLVFKHGDTSLVLSCSGEVILKNSKGGLRISSDGEVYVNGKTITINSAQHVYINTADSIETVEHPIAEIE